MATTAAPRSRERSRATGRARARADARPAQQPARLRAVPAHLADPRQGRPPVGRRRQRVPRLHERPRRRASWATATRRSSTRSQDQLDRMPHLDAARRHPEEIAPRREDHRARAGRREGPLPPVRHRGRPARPPPRAGLHEAQHLHPLRRPLPRLGGQRLRRRRRSRTRRARPTPSTRTPTSSGRRASTRRRRSSRSSCPGTTSRSSSGPSSSTASRSPSSSWRASTPTAARATRSRATSSACASCATSTASSSAWTRSSPASGSTSAAPRRLLGVTPDLTTLRQGRRRRHPALRGGRQGRDHGPLRRPHGGRRRDVQRLPPRRGRRPRLPSPTSRRTTGSSTGTWRRPRSG